MICKNIPYYKMQKVRSPWKYDYISPVEFFRDCKKDLFLYKTTCIYYPNYSLRFVSKWFVHSMY